MACGLTLRDNSQSGGRRRYSPGRAIVMRDSCGGYCNHDEPESNHKTDHPPDYFATATTHKRIRSYDGDDRHYGEEHSEKCSTIITKLLQDSLRSTVVAFGCSPLKCPADAHDIGKCLYELHEHRENEKECDGLKGFVFGQNASIPFPLPPFECP